MNALMAAQPAAQRQRAARRASPQGCAKAATSRPRWAAAPAARRRSAEMAVPCRIGDYTDFYTGIHHATTVGKLFRPDNPLLPNYKWVPIGYHGRASSIGVSGQRFKRPRGQTKARRCRRAELGAAQAARLRAGARLLRRRGQRAGRADRRSAQAEQHLFGVTLLNDWSARDIQAWEYQPLGPVPGQELRHHDLALDRDDGGAGAVPRARSSGPRAIRSRCRTWTRPPTASSGALDITLEVWLQTAQMREAGAGRGAADARQHRAAAYWTPAQLVAHHTVNGCNLQPGDLLGSGTLSGPQPDEAGSLLELTLGGKKPITLPNGETRTFLEDGDTLILRGYCERAGAVRIGLGECAGTVLPAVATPAA